MNNPLSGTDPTGYCKSSTVKGNEVTCTLDVEEGGESAEKTFSGTIGKDGVVNFSGEGTSGGNIVVNSSTTHQVMVTDGAQSIGGSYTGMFGSGGLNQSTKIHEIGAGFLRQSMIKTGNEGTADAKAQTSAMASDLAMLPVYTAGVVAGGVSAAAASAAAVRLITAYRFAGMGAVMAETQAIAVMEAVAVEAAGIASGAQLLPNLVTAPSVRALRALGVAEGVATKTTIPSAGGVIRQFEQPGAKIYYRVFSGDAAAGKWLTAVPPRSSGFAQEALALPPGNSATMIQEVRVPSGTMLERSRAIPVPEWGRFRGGAEQFQLLERLPEANYSPGTPLR